MKRQIQSRVRGIDMLGVRLAEASVTTSYARNAAEGTYATTVKKDGVNAGHYYILLDKVPAREPVVVANAFHASAKLFAVVTAYSAGEIQIRCFADDGTATAPTKLEVLILASDLASQSP